ncbi:hypothetical protein [Streptomyces sp. NPDC001774]
MRMKMMTAGLAAAMALTAAAGAASPAFAASAPPVTPAASAAPAAPAFYTSFRIVNNSSYDLTVIGITNRNAPLDWPQAYVQNDSTSAGHVIKAHSEDDTIGVWDLAAVDNVLDISYRVGDEGSHHTFTAELISGALGSGSHSANGGGTPVINWEGGTTTLTVTD